MPTLISHPPGPLEGGITCRFLADPGFGSNCNLHRAFLHHFRDPAARQPAARQRLGVNTRTQGLHEHLLPLSPSPASDTRSTRMAVTARPAHLPQEGPTDAPLQHRPAGLADPRVPRPPPCRRASRTSPRGPLGPQPPRGP